MTARHSVSLTVPTAFRADGNGLMEALGHGPDTFSVPLSPTGAGRPTHYGAHWWMDDETLDELTGLKARILPSGKDATGTGLTNERARNAGAAVSSADRVGGRPRNEFSKELATRSLQRIAPLDPVRNARRA